MTSLCPSILTIDVRVYPQPQSPSSSGFLLLPRERRDEIYQAVFARLEHEKTATISISSDATFFPSLPVLMRTCMQLYVEARTFFVRSTRFVIHDDGDLEATQQWLNDDLWPDSGLKHVQAVEFTSFETFWTASPS